MRLQQQTFVDKYIEKVILGIAAVIGLGIVFFYVLGTPYAVELKGQKAAPTEVEDSYRAQANQLKSAIARTEPPQELVKLVIPDYVGRFDARYTQSLLHSDSFYGIVFGPPGIPGTTVGDTQPRLVNIVRPPTPSDLSVTASHYVLEPDQVLLAYYTDMAHAQYPDSKPDEIKRIAADWTRRAGDLAGAKNPRDFHAASVSGTIKPQAWLEAFEKAAKADPDKAMDPSWYKDVLHFVANIEVRRQTLGADGQWPKDDAFEVIPPLPGAVSVIINDYIKQVQDAKTGAKKVDEDEAAQLQQLLVENLRFYLEDLSKPQFLPVKAHRPWQQPDQVIAQLSPEDQQAIFRLNQQISRLEAELRAMVGRTGAGEPGAAGGHMRLINPNDPYGMDDPRGGKTTKGQPKTPATPPKTVPNPKSKPPTSPTDPLNTKKNPNEERIAFSQAKLADLYKQKDEILAKLYKDETDPTKGDPSNPTKTDPSKIDPNKIDPRFRPDPTKPFVRPPEGRDPYRDPYGRDPRTGVRRPQPFDPRNPAIPGPDGGDDALPPIKVWAHDVTVKPGKTYRYQIIYKVINPLFNKDGSLVEAQKPEAGKLELASESTTWTSPVTIEPEVQYFVEDTNPQTNTVKWGIYRIYNGYRVHKQFDTRPGDPIGKAVEIDVKDDAGGKGGKELVDMRIPAMLVDLKSPPRPQGGLTTKGPVTVLLADLALGTMSTRDPAADKTDPERIRLSNEASGALTTPAPATGAAGERLPGNLPLPTPGRGNPLLPPEVRPPPR